MNGQGVASVATAPVPTVSCRFARYLSCRGLDLKEHTHDMAARPQMLIVRGNAGHAHWPEDCVVDEDVRTAPDAGAEGPADGGLSGGCAELLGPLAAAPPTSPSACRAPTAGVSSSTAMRSNSAVACSMAARIPMIIT